MTNILNEVSIILEENEKLKEKVEALVEIIAFRDSAISRLTCELSKCEKIGTELQAKLSQKCHFWRTISEYEEEMGTVLFLFLDYTMINKEFDFAIRCAPGGGYDRKGEMIFSIYMKTPDADLRMSLSSYSYPDYFMQILLPNEITIEEEEKS